MAKKPQQVVGDIADAKNAVVILPQAAVVNIVDGKGAKVAPLTAAQFAEFMAVVRRALS